MTPMIGSNNKGVPAGKILNFRLFIVLDFNYLFSSVHTY